MSKNKKIPYGKQWIDEKDIKEVLKVLNTDWVTQGPKVEEFEKEVAKYCGAKYAVAVSSGTAALHLACLSIGLKDGDEAITSPITFLATSNSVLYTGAKPIFADIDYETVNIDSEEIKKKITRKTKALLLVHFSGLPCNMPEIHKIAEERGLKIIEDACHALGAEYKYNGKWIKVGSCKHSDMAVFSFHPVKHITTGEGGAITTNNKDVYEKLLVLRSHGMVKNEKIIKQKGGWFYKMRDLGFNYRITDFQCALGISQLKKIDKFIKRRREIVEIYKKEFKDNRFFDLPIEEEATKSAWHLYAIKLKGDYIKKRRKIFEKLRENGIGTQVHYIPVHTQPYYKKHLGYKSGDYPVAESYYKRTITLPLFPKMTDSDIKKIVNLIRSTFNEYKK